MPHVTVGLGTRSYDIVTQDGILSTCAGVLTPFARNRRFIVVTDENVSASILPRLAASLGQAGIAVDPLVFPAGEGSKSWDSLARLCDLLIEREIERSDHVIALGGGVIGDLVGFADSFVKRGCNFIQIPTTLLAQVDSSVGGKTAINTAAGKNLVGSFHQPTLVLIDPSVLDSLPPRELRAGYAEVLKYGLLGDAAFFSWCEERGPGVVSGDRAAQHHAIETSVTAKARIVEADERETADLRALLNLGHTFGHALEAETGFSDALLHGEAVAAGMALAFRFSAARGHCPAGDAERVSRHLHAAGLPAGIGDCAIRASGDRLVGHMLHDKKRAGGTLPFVLVRGIGEAYVDKSVSLTEVAAFLDREAQ